MFLATKYLDVHVYGKGEDSNLGKSASVNYHKSNRADRSVNAPKHLRQSCRRCCRGGQLPSGAAGFSRAHVCDQVCRSTTTSGEERRCCSRLSPLNCSTWETSVLPNHTQVQCVTS